MPVTLAQRPASIRNYPYQAPIVRTTCGRSAILLELHLGQRRLLPRPPEIRSRRAGTATISRTGVLVFLPAKNQWSQTRTPSRPWCFRARTAEASGLPVRVLTSVTSEHAAGERRGVRRDVQHVAPVDEHMVDADGETRRLLERRRARSRARSRTTRSARAAAPYVAAVGPLQSRRGRRHRVHRRLEREESLLDVGAEDARERCRARGVLMPSLGDEGVGSIEPSGWRRTARSASSSPRSPLYVGSGRAHATLSTTRRQ